MLIKFKVALKNSLNKINFKEKSLGIYKRSKYFYIVSRLLKVNIYIRGLF